MCIFTQPVITVNGTQIFARLTGNGSQLLAYQMNYESREPNAMILPIPVKQPAADADLRFIDLSGYESFFDDLDKGFPFQAPVSIGCGLAINSKVAGRLAVFKVGNYIASFIPKLADFDRLDPQFRLPNDMWSRFPSYANFGFAVFQLAAGSLKPHPMAFEFRSDTSDLFFPTVHIHDQQMHAFEEFDHMLYMQHAGLDSRVHAYQNSHVEDPSTGLIRSKFLASSFCDVERTAGLIRSDLLLHRKILNGSLPNRDTFISAAGNPLVPTFNWRRLVPMSPWLLVPAALISWIFYRRAKLGVLRASNN